MYVNCPNCNCDQFYCFLTLGRDLKQHSPDSACSCIFYSCPASTRLRMSCGGLLQAMHIDKRCVWSGEQTHQNTTKLGTRGSCQHSCLSSKCRFCSYSAENEMKYKWQLRNKGTGIGGGKIRKISVSFTQLPSFRVFSYFFIDHEHSRGK